MLKQTLQSDQLTAMKSGDKVKLQAIRYIVAQLKYKEIEKQAELTDEDVLATIRKLVKEQRETMEISQKANRPDLVAECEVQIAILTSYLPAELSDEDLKKAVEELVAANQAVIAQNAKAIIGVVMGKLKTQADPSRIQAVLRDMKLM
jgi:uncharacterized protein